MGDGTVAIGAATNVSLVITAQPDVIFTPMELEIIVPFQDNAPRVRICKAEIIHRGENLPCFDRVAKNASIAYDSK